MTSRRAQEAYEEFHWGNEPDEILEVASERFAGEELVQLGALRAVIYTTQKGDEPPTDYIHDFELEGDETPRLCVDEDGELAIIGGGYDVTPRGIER